ncbi:hypothetical protein FW774_15270 [Pedobacter sp. BS3]|uniref:immunoglobulin domain-containing protein n=1 Tax=Pedobacter sp. BS3 TaxID=2567937 RepID=UPI0011ED4E54|nr:hypothetical protein [Pedobacter sp. BS3]TZF82053.1 hypothetical protein FW774_15270 [Pedobacter sp. BS3]
MEHGCNYIGYSGGRLKAVFSVILLQDERLKRLREMQMFRFGYYVIGIIMLVIPEGMYAQCISRSRTYASFQGVYRTGLGALGKPVFGGSITHAENAVNKDPENASTLTVNLGLAGLASVTQFLEFTTDGTHANKRLIAANTPVTVKMSLPVSALDLLGGIEIGTFTNLTSVSESWPWLPGSGNYSGYNSGNKTVAYTGTSLASVLNGAGEAEITFTPAQAYNGVYIKLSGNALSVALSASIFHAYILEDNPDPVSCGEAIDVLSGVKAGAVAIANATGSVTNPWNAVDADPSNTTFALLSTGAQVLSKVYETVLFSNSSQPGDSVRIVLQDPGASLLDLSLLTGFTIQPYLGNTAVGPPLDKNSIGLNLRLLAGAGNKYVLAAPVTGAFDRVEIAMGGITNALSGLRIYNVKRVIPDPVTGINGVVATAKAICEGASVALSVTGTQSCTTYSWYDAETGGNLLATTTTYNPGILTSGTHIFYVQAQRQNCTDAVSVRTPVTITVDPLPAVALAANPEVCSGATAATISYTGESGSPVTYSISWDPAAQAAGLNAVNEAVLTAGDIDIIIPPETPSGSYSGILTVKNAAGCTSPGQPFTITVNPRPTSPHISLATN